METSTVTRRRFLRQSFAFSALATLGSVPGAASLFHHDPAATDLLMIGDWGWDADGHTAQTAVANAMRHHVQQNHLHTRALLMLGDN